MNSSAFQLGIFAKYWQPGAVKTRLAHDVGHEAAAELHRQFLTTLVRRMAKIDASRVLCFTPADRRAEFANVADFAWRLEPQSAGDLGQRMVSYFHNAFERGCERVVLIGSDSPNLPLEFVDQAFQQLKSFPVVLGPSADGGYYLIGAARDVPPIFDGMAWSTPNVWERTLSRLAAAQIPVAQLPPWYDVDNVDDLCRLAADLDQAGDEPLRELATAMKAVLGTTR